MTRAIITQLVEALEVGWSPAIGSLGREEKANAAITAAREYLATEPSGERAELIEKLRNFAREFEIECHVECIEDAVNMLEADAQQAKQVPMSKEELEFLVEDIAEWSSHVQVDTAPTTLAKHVEKVLAHHGIGGEA